MTTPSRRLGPSLRDVLDGMDAEPSSGGRRKLTDDEKATVREWAVRREKERHPSAKITITVCDEVDVYGNARYRALVLSEEVAEGVII